MKKIIFGTLVIIIILLIALLLLWLSGLKKSLPPKNPSQNTQQKFSITNVSPKNGAVNVSAGEITISFTATNPIINDKSFSINVVPNPAYPLKIEQNFPTQTVKTDVLGGLQTNTTYQIIIKNALGESLYSGSFTTASKPAESSTGLIDQRDQNTITNYYPLANDIPYTADDFRVDYYEDRLKLHVTILTRDSNLAKKELYNWIKSKGVDPATHSYDFVSVFQ